MSLEVKEVVLGAFQTQETENDKTPAPEEKGSKVEDPKVEDQNEEVEDEADDEDEDEGEVESTEDKERRTQKALEILAVLEDPSKSRQFVKALASSLEEVPEKQQAKAAQSVLDELVNELGEENKFMIEPFLKMFEKLANRRDDKLHQQINSIRQEIATEKLNSQFESFMESKNVTPEEQELIQKFAEKVKPGEKVTFKQYLGTLHELAKNELARKANKERKGKQVERNKEETKQNNASKTNAKEPSDERQKQAAIKTPKDAVALALEQIMGNKD